MTAPRDRKHIIIPMAPMPEGYASPRRHQGSKVQNPPPDRRLHAAALKADLDEAVREAVVRRTGAPSPPDPQRVGIYLTFESSPKEKLNLEQLENPRAGVELVACLKTGEQECATVFVPDGQRGFFLKRLEAYGRSTGAAGDTGYRDLMDRIAAIRLATLRALWTDVPETFPAAQDRVWWEVWLRRTDGREVERLRAFAKTVSVEVGARRLDFEDRIVVVVLASADQLSASIDVLGDLAEVRRARESPMVFDRMPSTEQRAWAEDAAHSLTPPNANAPAVCVLDTGVHQPHPLLAIALPPSDCHVVDPQWVVTDNHGHGTQMAGLALHGDLVEVLLSSAPSTLTHRLESVKIIDLPRKKRYDLYGSITIDAVERVENAQPERRRCFSLAITEERTLEERQTRPSAAQPTSWSAAIDALAAGRVIYPHRHGQTYLTGQAPRRLFVVSAGNIRTPRVQYLEDCDTEAIEDPAHAWNVLTVGASTHLTSIDEPAHVKAGWRALAPAGDLSPYSRTGMLLENTWPIKPDVVFEGGNAAKDGGGNVDHGLASLSLLTTGIPTTGLPRRGVLDISNGTSAATAQVARIAATVMAEYPELWPETVRALVVHSARWTPAMEAHLPRKRTKRAAARLARRYGFGIPSRERATRSAKDALTLVTQGQLLPYLPNGQPQMHLHALPWPREALQALGAATVRLRVTLSYFIEPNPARRGWRSRFRYASHALRFELKDPTETVKAFRQRVNRMAREDSPVKAERRSNDGGWLFGTTERHRGSLHGDCWTGSAAKLAERNCIAIFPATGWWKDVPPRDGAPRTARYALVVSIEADSVSVDIDLWTPVASAVGIALQVEG